VANRCRHTLCHGPSRPFACPNRIKTIGNALIHSLVPIRIVSYGPFVTINFKILTLSQRNFTFLWSRSNDKNICRALQGCLCLAWSWCAVNTGIITGIMRSLTSHSSRPGLALVSVSKGPWPGGLPLRYRRKLMNNGIRDSGHKRHSNEQ
jgi:hypothetical protein